MTSNIKFTRPCTLCWGSGIRKYNAVPGGLLLEENPCSGCGGDGIATADQGIEPAWFDAVTAELDYIHGKVTAIWNQVKPGN